MKKQFSETMLALLLLVRLVLPAPCVQDDVNDKKGFSCPGPDVLSERVRFRYKGTQLKISCTMKCKVKSNEVSSYLESIPIPQNLTWVIIRDCPLPQKSFKVWLQRVNSLPGRLIELEVTFSKNCSNSDCPDPHHSFSSTCFHLPSNLFDGLQNLQRLILRLDLMTSLPSGIFDNLFNLQELEVKGQLSSIEHGALANLKELRILDIGGTSEDTGGNQLERVPDLKQLRKLEELYIRHNRISRLNRDMLLHNSELTLFKATNNAISEMPENFFNSCLSLKTIWLDKNNLTSLPKTLFKNLTSLTTLTLALNNLTSLPKDLQ